MPDKMDSKTEDPTDEVLDRHLQMAALGVYENKLRARSRIKSIVREMGLLNKSKTINRKNLYESLDKVGGEVLLAG